MPDERVVKVKYGLNPEIPAEIAGTRLLAALGFGADHTSLVTHVQCVGCPWSPFRLRQLAEWYLLSSVFDRTIDHSRSRDFEWATVERKMEGHTIAAGPTEGVGWWELNQVDAARGGASRAEVDALRLMAMVLVHWDNKMTNQRLVCLDAGRERDATTPCRLPLIMIQDVGASFGPKKVDYNGWRATPIWSSDGGCVVSMHSLLYHGGTFPPAQISEGGRLLLTSRLRQLTERAAARSLHRREISRSDHRSSARARSHAMGAGVSRQGPPDR